MEITPNYGNAPNVDGIIDSSVGEWDSANKNEIELYQNLSNPQNGLPIDFWVLQNNSHLYVSIQFELELSELDKNQFVGLLISDSTSENPEDFEDAKIIRFSNISLGEFQYLDYHVNNSIFQNDTIINGNGAGSLDGNKVVYEFSLPINDNETQDVELYYRDDKAFKVIFAKEKSNPEEFTHQNIIIIEPDYPPDEKELSLLEIIYLVLTYIIFSTAIAFWGIYIYRITRLKEKIKRIKS